MTVNERVPVKPFASLSTSTGQSPSVCFCALYPATEAFFAPGLSGNRNCVCAPLISREKLCVTWPAPLPVSVQSVYITQKTGSAAQTPVQSSRRHTSRSSSRFIQSPLVFICTQFTTNAPILQPRLTSRYFSSAILGGRVRYVIHCRQNAFDRKGQIL